MSVGRIVDACLSYCPVLWSQKRQKFSSNNLDCKMNFIVFSVDLLTGFCLNRMIDTESC